jgi:hypothetical protein
VPGGVVFKSFLWLGEQIAETAEAVLPHRPAILNPLLRCIQPLGIDAAGAYPSDFFGTHQAGFFEDLQVLDDRS